MVSNNLRMKTIYWKLAKPGSGRKHLRKLSEEHRSIAEKTSQNKSFQEKFTHPRRLRKFLPEKASPVAPMLRNWRRKNNWYMKQAASILEVPFDTYRGWEAGKHLPSTMARNVIRRRMKEFPGKG